LLIEDALKEVWCKETCADPDNWTKENPAYGQCAVTSMLVYNLLDAKIMRVVLPNGSSHYFNLLNDTIIDYTAKQFDYVIDYTDAETRSCEYLLNNEDTKRRFYLLMDKFFNLTRNINV
jgi:hypothetical protein